MKGRINLAKEERKSKYTKSAQLSSLLPNYLSTLISSILYEVEGDAPRKPGKKGTISYTEEEEESTMPKPSEPSDDQLENFKKGCPKAKVITMSNGAPIHDKNNSLTVGPRGPLLMQDVVFMDEMAHFDRERIPERVHFSGGEAGSADTARDPRGFAVKFYTEEGNWDLVGFSLEFISIMVMFLMSDRGTPDGFRHMNGYGSHTFKMVNADGKAVYCKFHFKVIRHSVNPLSKQLSTIYY
ncbi:unnamed protein product, partial [Strongylus vulgaris]